MTGRVFRLAITEKIRRRLEHMHITGPLRTLSQDIAFGIGQLVEVAIRAAQGVSLFGPRNRNVASRMESSPSAAISRRPSPRPR